MLLVQKVERDRVEMEGMRRNELKERVIERD